MDKIDFLKDRILAAKHLIITDDNVIYRVREQRGMDIYMTLDLATAIDADSPASKLLPIRDTCFGYLRYLISKAEIDSQCAEGVAWRQVVTDLVFEQQQAKINLNDVRKEERKHRLALQRWTASVKVREQDQRTCVLMWKKYPIKEQKKLDLAKAKQAEIMQELAPVLEALPIAQERRDKAFKTIGDISVFLQNYFKWTVCPSTLARYASENQTGSQRTKARNFARN
jgi:hypothetical protein